jgi:hypothetical protein
MDAIVAGTSMSGLTFFVQVIFFVAGQPFRIFPAGSVKTGGV